MGRARGMYGEKKYAYRVLVGMSEEKTLHGRPVHRQQDNIKMIHQEI
jgi:hypothetical protein